MSMSTQDARIGGNLAQLRGAMSQASLAAAMKARGWKWSQPTVAAIEKGERALKLAEAEDIVAILNLNDLEELTTRPLEAIWWARSRAMDTATRALEIAASSFLSAQWALAEVADRLEEQGIDVDAEEGGETAAMLTETASNIVARSVVHAAIVRADALGKWASFLLETEFARHLPQVDLAEGGGYGAPSDPAE